MAIAFLLIGVSLAAGSVRADSTIVVSGTVTDVDGDPFPGVTIVIRNTGSQATYNVTTDSNGWYSRSIAAGNYSIMANYTGYMANITYENVTTSGNDLDFFMYEILGTVKGYVTDGNRPIIGATVTLAGANVTSYAYTVKPLSEYRFENVTPGSYVIYATKEGYNISSPVLISLNKGTVLEVPFTLDEIIAQYAKLSGRVTYNGDPMEGVKVVLTPEEGAELVTVTDSKGNYTFSHVPPGEYTVRLSKDGFVTTDKGLTIEPLKSIVQDFSMKRNTLPGNSGFVLDYDLSHSMMVVGLGLALLVTMASLFLRQRIKRNPDLLAREEEPAPSKE